MSNYQKSVLSLLFVSLISLFVLLMLSWYGPPWDIEQKGSDETFAVQYVALATAIVSLLTAIVGLFKSNFGRRSGVDS